MFVEEAAKQINDEMIAIYKDACHSYGMVKHWVSHFQMGISSVQDEPRIVRQSIAGDTSSVQDEPRIGRLSIVDDTSNVARVLVLSDRHIPSRKSCLSRH